LTGAGQTDPQPASVGQKFDATGAVLPFPGNTFLCHIPPNGEAHAALREASLALQAGPMAGTFSFLPPASFHMTVFEGVVDAGRMDARWPEGVANDLALEAVTDRFLAAVAPLEVPAAHRIRPMAVFGGFSLAVAGATPEDEASLRHCRQLLSDATGIRRPDFATYGFHVTLAYPLRWLTVAEAEAVIDLSERVFDRLQARAPEIALGRIEFCSFDDMHLFRPLRLLGTP
jgi:hypothetical protein